MRNEQNERTTRNKVWSKIEERDNENFRGSEGETHCEVQSETKDLKGKIRQKGQER